MKTHEVEKTWKTIENTKKHGKTMKNTKQHEKQETIQKTRKLTRQSRKTRKRGGSRPEGSDMAPRAVPNQDSESPIDIVKDNDEYEKKAFSIATNRMYLEDLKFRLKQSRTKSSLFDTKRFTENLEKIYIK